MVLKRIPYGMWTLFLCCALSVSCSHKKPVGQTWPVQTPPQQTPVQPVLDIDEEAAPLQDHQIPELTLRVQQLEQKVAALEALIRKKSTVRPVYKIEYTDPATLYQKARDLCLKKDFINAAKIFRAFIREHPKHHLADNALYWLGECQYSLGRHEAAVSDFKILVKQYPKSEKVPDALLKTGYTYNAMGNGEQADIYFKEVLKKYPFSPAAEKAQKKLKTP